MVHAQMALWVSAVVLFTLTVNATALGPLMRWLGLNKSTPLQRMMHRSGARTRDTRGGGAGAVFVYVGRRWAPREGGSD